MATQIKDLPTYEETPSIVDGSVRHVTATAVAYGGIKSCATKFGGSPILLNNGNG